MGSGQGYARPLNRREACKGHHFWGPFHRSRNSRSARRIIKEV
nr:MAG TPA: hypothetical protein [Caudoviricetes sp.]